MRYLYSHTIDQYLFNVELLALATLYFAARQVGHNVVICATMCFNLQCNNVASQVEKRWPYLPDRDLIANKRDSIGFIGFTNK